MSNKERQSSKGCYYCGAQYRKADFHICPHCGADGGGVTPKTWRPPKAARKEFAKKMNESNHN